jgi:hypothetical protein
MIVWMKSVHITAVSPPITADNIYDVIKSKVHGTYIIEIVNSIKS